MVEDSSVHVSLDEIMIRVSNLENTFIVLKAEIVEQKTEIVELKLHTECVRLR